MPSLKIRLLGSFVVSRDEEFIAPEEWPTQKTKDLLKILLTERGHVVPKERLMELLWPDLTPRSAANSLRVGISHLRRILEPALDRPANSTFILTHSQGYTFHLTPRCWIDVDAFQNVIARGQQSEQREEWGPAIAAYQAAQEVYRGDYLEEDRYEDWAIGPREQLREAYLDGLSRLAECHAHQGHHRRALAACQKVLALDPLREGVYRQVMVYHYRLGQRDQALRAFEQCRGLLAEELGVDPMPETVELHTRILREEAVDDPVLIRSTPVPARPGRRPLPAWLPFVGREAETEALAGHLAAAMEGLGRLVLIAGEAGVGKTRLAEEFLALAEEHGAQVFQGRAYELERDLPFQPVREALRRNLFRRLDPERAQQVLGRRAPYVALLVPEIKQFMPDFPSLDPVLPEEERHRLLTGLTRFCLSLAAQHPVVFFVDDLQWADPSSLQFLHFLVRHIAQERVLVLGTYRREEVEPDHHLTAMERHLMREGLAVRQELQRLTRTAVTDLVEQKGAPGWDCVAFSQRLYQETEGNALFVAELIRSLLEAGWLIGDEAGRWQPAPGIDLENEALGLPATAQAVIEARCHAAGSTGQRILRTAAVIGRTFTFDLLRRASGLGTEVLLDTLDVLLARQLVHEHLEADRGGYDFSHDKIREVIYGSLSPARRIHLHGKVAVALEAVYRGRTDEVAAELALHYTEAGDVEKAVDYLLQAGDRARGLYAHQEAIDYYERALEFLKDRSEHERAARTLMKMGLTYHTAFEFRKARRVYDEGFALWQRVGTMQSSVPPPAPHAFRVVGGDPDTLDPAKVSADYQVLVINQLFSGLLELTPELEVIPCVAATWEVLNGGRKYVFHLRDDVRWSDGTAVTAGDFEYAWKRVLDPTTESPRAGLLYDVQGASAFHQGRLSDPDLVGVKALDEVTLSVGLEEPAAYFLYVVADPACYAVPRHVVEVHGAAWAEEANIVTNGPFKLEDRQRGKSIFFLRNSDYHGRFTGNVERVELYDFLRDRPAALELYEADGLDIFEPHGLPQAEVERARQQHAGDYVSVPMLSTFYGMFDVSRPPFDDPRVRRAFVHASDRETLADIVMRGYELPATGGFVPPGMPGHSAGIAQPYDPDLARQLLADAGYPGGRGLPAVVLVPYTRLIPNSKYLEAQWREILGAEIVQWKEDDRPPPHVVLEGWGADYPDPDVFLRVALQSAQYSWQTLHNRNWWQNDTYDRLIERARRIPDQAERMKLYARAERILLDEAAIMPLSYERGHILVKPWVSKYPTSAINLHFWKDVVIEPH
jgi:ABC-type oligopeptide transport system substrate-binding subunit/DNA-binding SARP family transcriptional activator